MNNDNDRSEESLPDINGPSTADNGLKRAQNFNFRDPRPKRKAKELANKHFIDLSDEETEQDKLDRILGKDDDSDEYSPRSEDEVASDHEIQEEYVSVTPRATSPVIDERNRTVPLNNPRENYYPSIEHLGKGVYRIPGKRCPIFVAPRDDYCSMDGKRIKSRWCNHLKSAGLRENPPIFTPDNAVPQTSLTRVSKSQKISKLRSGRKRPRPFDYPEVDFNDNPPPLLSPSEEISLPQDSATTQSSSSVEIVRRTERVRQQVAIARIILIYTCGMCVCLSVSVPLPL